MSENFVLLRMTYLRGVNIGLFAYDYDMTWTAFFLDAEGRIYSRYGSRDSSSADSHNSAAGLVHTMAEVLRVHKEETAKEKPAYQLPAAVQLFKQLDDLGEDAGSSTDQQAVAWPIRQYLHQGLVLEMLAERISGECRKIRRTLPRDLRGLWLFADDDFGAL